MAGSDGHEFADAFAIQSVIAERVINRGGWTVSANSRQCLIQHYPSMFFTIAKTTTTTVLIMPQKIATSVITVACARVSRDVLSKSSFIAVSSHK